MPGQTSITASRNSQVYMNASDGGYMRTRYSTKSGDRFLRRWTRPRDKDRAWPWPTNAPRLALRKNRRSRIENRLRPERDQHARRILGKVSQGEIGRAH